MLQTRAKSAPATPATTTFGREPVRYFKLCIIILQLCKSWPESVGSFARRVETVHLFGYLRAAYGNGLNCFRNYVKSFIMSYLLAGGLHKYTSISLNGLNFLYISKQSISVDCTNRIKCQVRIAFMVMLYVAAPTQYLWHFLGSGAPKILYLMWHKYAKAR